jgi:hypothetical protein
VFSQIAKGGDLFRMGLVLRWEEQTGLIMNYLILGANRLLPRVLGGLLLTGIGVLLLVLGAR